MKMLRTQARAGKKAKVLSKERLTFEKQENEKQEARNCFFQFITNFSKRVSCLLPLNLNRRSDKFAQRQKKTFLTSNLSPLTSSSGAHVVFRGLCPRTPASLLKKA